MVRVSKPKLKPRECSARPFNLLTDTWLYEEIGGLDIITCDRNGAQVHAWLPKTKVIAWLQRLGLEVRRGH